MSNLFKKLSTLIILIFVTSSLSFAQKKYFSGIYTIGGSNANYQTIQKALTDLLAQNSEVIGRVTFNIRPGTYNENLTFKPFVGASAKNFVIFKSETGKASDVIIQDDGDNTLYSNQVIRFEGCSFYTLSDLTIINNRNITASNNFASVIHLTYNRDTRKPSESNTITRCIIKVDEDFTIFNGNTIPIVASDINNTSLQENCANYNTISNNQIYGGAFGLRLLGKSTAQPARGNKVFGNKFFNCYSGIDIDYNNIPLLASNEINCRINPNESQFGIRIRNASGNFSWHSNIVRDYGTFGMFIYNVNAGAAGYIYNNMITGNAKNTYSRGMHVEWCRNLQFFHNSVYYTGSYSVENAAFVLEHSTNFPSQKISIKNNIFSSQTSITVNIKSTTALDTSNYNVYHTQGAILARVNDVNRNNLTALRTGTTKDQQSLSLSPQFTSTTTLRVNNNNENIIGKAAVIPFILFDFENHPRDPETPDFGADEVIRSNTDLQTFGLERNFVPKEGLNTLPVVIKNDGLNSLNGESINISYKVDNGAYTNPETFQLTQLSKSYSKQIFNLAQQWNIPNPGQYVLTLKVSPAVPNDTWNKNDSVVLNICVGLNGLYTIGGPAGAKNFVNFAAAIAAFGCGVGGPTVFNVYPGTYPPFSLPALKGVSATNTLTIKSVTGNAADVIIQNTTTNQNNTNHHTVQLDGTDYVIFKNLTITNTASTTQFASGIHVTNNSDFITVDSCIITVPLSSSPNDKRYAVVLSDKSKIDSGAFTRGITVMNSNLRNGHTAVQIFGRNLSTRSSNINVVNNRIDSVSFFGFNSSFANIASVSRNIIAFRTAADASSEGIRIVASRSDAIINANRITRAGYRGINLTSVEGATDFVISNNMIGGGFKSTLNGAGIYFNEVNKISLYNNSVRYDAVSTEVPNNSAAFFLASGSNVSLYNNIFFCPSGGYAFFVTSTTSLRASDYNIYYTDADPNNGLYAFWNNSDRSNMTALKAAMQGFELNSLEVNPGFVSNLDLHTTNLAVESKGKYFPSINTDFDQEPRNPTGTDIGADEFIPNAKDLALLAINPLVFSTNPNTIKVQMMNLGSQSLNGTTIKLQYSSDGTNWVPAGGESLTIGSNANNSLSTPYSNFEFAFTNTFNATANTSYPFYVRVLPSDRVVGDPITKNDTVFNLICTGLNAGTYTIGGTNPSFADFTSAANALACGITGPVTFNVRPGTYNERFTINNPKNTSATNRIVFQSETGNANDVIISNTGVSTNTTRNIVRLNRSKFITFKGITFRNFSNSIVGSAAIQITSQASDIIIRECVILLDTNSSSPNVFGITSTDSASLVTDGLSGSNIHIINNKIFGGNLGVYLRGRSQFQRESGIRIDSNIFYKNAQFAILTSYNDIVSINANNIKMRPAQQNSTGISIQFNRADTRITNNVINNAAVFGVNLNDNLGINGILFANNMIGGKFRNLTAGAGLNLVKVSPLKLYYNSILYTGNLVTSAALKADDNTRNVRLLNNTIYNSSQGFCMDVYENTFDTSDNNNLFTKGTLFSRVGPVDYINFEEFRESSLTDEKSVSVDPDYFTDSNLHITNQFLDAGALPIAEVPRDIDNELRNAEFPDIGADEFLIRGDAEILSIDQPLPSPEVYPSKIQVVVTVKNPGLSKISGLNLKYYVDNVEVANEVIPVEEPYKPLLPTDVLTYTFATQFEPAATGTYNLRVEAYLPDDIDLTNNSQTVNFFSSISSIVDGTVSTIVQPAVAKVEGKTPVSVLIKNSGTVTIKDFNVNFNVTGGEPSDVVVRTEYFSDSILPQQSASFIFTDSIDCHPTNVRKLNVWISDLQNDINLQNDRIEKFVINFAGCFQSLDLVTEAMIMTAPWPNPSNTSFNFDLNLLESGDVTIELVDVLGKTVKSISMNNMVPGQQAISIDVDDVTPGVYYTRVNFNNHVLTNKVLVSE